MIRKAKVLIVVKTYPSLSERYDELVCTAGFLEDGSWIRIYPVPYRKLNYAQQYNKWQWIELDLIKNSSDFRPESYRPANLDEEIKMLEKIDTRNNWALRKEYVLKTVFTNISSLLEKSKSDGTSLAVVKPKTVFDFICEPCEREWDENKIKRIKANQAQGSLFEENESAKEIFRIVNKLPYKFSYTFETEDGVHRTLMVEDWELGALYWNCLKSANGDEVQACKKVREQYFDKFIKHDLYFILGTTKKFHNVSPNPFIIIGVFYPPKIENKQLSLF